MHAPVLVLAVGNPSRGDDALGPMLAERLERAALPGVEVIVDFQLQVEHSLELEQRRLVVFVDAAVNGAAPFELRSVRPLRDASHTTHALSPAAVLETYARVTGNEPPAALALAVRGSSFGLGEELSAEARHSLESAWQELLRVVTTGEGSGRGRSGS
jgi:hydrogenase maturation protease